MIVKKGDFFLKGYSNENLINLSFNGKLITIINDSKQENQLKLLEKEITKVSETTILSIEGEDKSENILNIAIDIKNLLSIGIGKRIIFDRQRFWKGEDYEITEKEMSKNCNSGNQIIPDFCLKQYLEESLPVWNKFTEEEKLNIFAIVNYLNQTNVDFIEDRILRTVQAWECFGHYFIAGVELTDDLKELKNQINKTYKAWKKEKNYKDVNGEIGNKLSISLDQEKLMLKMDKIISNYGLNISKINLNLKDLKNLRDQVAHTGRIGISGAEAYGFLHPGVVGLQLIILKKLGYTGHVFGKKEGWKSIEKIEDYFE